MSVTLHSVSPRFRLALLIDGENLSCAHADRIEAAAAAIGERQIVRVYGDAQRLAGWEQRGGLMLVHTGSGKNAADLRLCIDAVDLAHRKKLDGFVIASSDGDFLHLAQYLREAGFLVVGLGETKTPVRFRHACTRFELLQPPPPPKASGPIVVLNPIDRQLRSLILEEGTSRGMKMALLGSRMHTRFKITLAKAGTTSWSGYLRAHGDLYSCDPKGPNALVRWIGPKCIMPA